MKWLWRQIQWYYSKTLGKLFAKKIPPGVTIIETDQGPLEIPHETEFGRVMKWAYEEMGGKEYIVRVAE